MPKLSCGKRADSTLYCNRLDTNCRQSNLSVDKKNPSLFMCVWNLRKTEQLSEHVITTTEVKRDYIWEYALYLLTD